ncbi:hypothetical protein GGS21DRAFT_499340 [Xylaria nigripes]|nr:hypothetical protein GGS21DRAFT_499340 [Xylaria nigripes]
MSTIDVSNFSAVGVLGQLLTLLLPSVSRSSYDWLPAHTRSPCIERAIVGHQVLEGSITSLEPAASRFQRNARPIGLRKGLART